MPSGRPRQLDPEQLRAAARVGAAAGKAAADRRAAALAGVIADLRGQGIISTVALCRALVARGVPTARGGVWTPTQVGRVLRRLDGMQHA